MRSATRLLLLLLTAALAAVPASAADKFFSLWTVEPAQITSEVLVLHEKDFVQRARLLPIGLAEVEADVLVGPTGITAIRAGEQVFELAGGTANRPRQTAAAVFCQVKPGDWQGGGLYGLFGARQFRLRYCVVDNEKDGFFDNAFATQDCFADFPILQTKIPKTKEMATLNRLGYRRLPVEDITDGPSVGIVYDGTALLDGDPRFIQSFGSGNPLPLFGEKHSRAGDSPGQRTSFGGAAFTVVAVEGDAVRLRNDRPIPAQPFAMFSTGTC